MTSYERPRILGSLDVLLANFQLKNDKMPSEIECSREAWEAIRQDFVPLSPMQMLPESVIGLLYQGVPLRWVQELAPDEIRLIGGAP